jgi:2-polyprenyl-3-methyl-5-hydroxy-6-metoxy-1,4-benzoquinol methylase
MAATSPTVQPSPLPFFEAVNSFQKSAALRAAIELDVFTAIADGAATPAALAEKCQASERGMRILCDYLTVHGFLEKTDAEYALPPNSAIFLNRHSQAWIGSIVYFLTHPVQMERFRDLTASVRKGGAADASEIETDHPMWADFARFMAPLMFPASQEIGELLGASAGGPCKILDVAASHGVFGITIAQKNANARVVALDWPHVLEVARENAARMGVSDRHSTIGGDALAVDWGSDHDLVLLTNFLHHFDRATCERLLRKAHASLKSGGRVAILEFVPNNDRISPPLPAAFSLIMLANTPAGDAYTLDELQAMTAAAGLSNVTAHTLSNHVQTLVVATKS